MGGNLKDNGKNSETTKGVSLHSSYIPLDQETENDTVDQDQENTSWSVNPEYLIQYDDFAIANDERTDNAVGENNEQHTSKLQDTSIEFENLNEFESLSSVQYSPNELEYSSTEFLTNLDHSSLDLRDFSYGFDLENSSIEPMHSSELEIHLEAHKGITSSSDTLSFIKDGSIDKDSCNQIKYHNNGTERERGNKKSSLNITLQTNIDRTTTHTNPAEIGNPITFSNTQVMEEDEKNDTPRENTESVGVKDQTLSEIVFDTIAAEIERNVGQEISYNEVKNVDINHDEHSSRSNGFESFEEHPTENDSEEEIHEQNQDFELEMQDSESTSEQHKTTGLQQGSKSGTTDNEEKYVKHIMEKQLQFTSTFEENNVEISKDHVPKFETNVNGKDGISAKNNDDDHYKKLENNAETNNEMSTKENSNNHDTGAENNMNTKGNVLTQHKDDKYDTRIVENIYTKDENELDSDLIIITSNTGTPSTFLQGNSVFQLEDKDYDEKQGINVENENRNITTDAKLIKLPSSSILENLNQFGSDFQTKETDFDTSSVKTDTNISVEKKRSPAVKNVVTYSLNKSRRPRKKRKKLNMSHVKRDRLISIKVDEKLDARNENLIRNDSIEQNEEQKCSDVDVMLNSSIELPENENHDEILKRNAENLEVESPVIGVNDLIGNGSNTDIMGAENEQTESKLVKDNSLDDVTITESYSCDVSDLDKIEYRKTQHVAALKAKNLTQSTETSDECYINKPSDVTQNISQEKIHVENAPSTISLDEQTTEIPSSIIDDHHPQLNIIKKVQLTRKNIESSLDNNIISKDKGLNSSGTKENPKTSMVSKPKVTKIPVLTKNNVQQNTKPAKSFTKISRIPVRNNFVQDTDQNCKSSSSDNKNKEHVNYIQNVSKLHDDEIVDKKELVFSTEKEYPAVNLATLENSCEETLQNELPKSTTSINDEVETKNLMKTSEIESSSSDNYSESTETESDIKDDTKDLKNNSENNTRNIKEVLKNPEKLSQNIKNATTISIKHSKISKNFKDISTENTENLEETTEDSAEESVYSEASSSSKPKVHVNESKNTESVKKVDNTKTIMSSQSKKLNYAESLESSSLSGSNIEGLLESSSEDSQFEEEQLEYVTESSDEGEHTSEYEEVKKINFEEVVREEMNIEVKHLNEIDSMKVSKGL